MDIAIASVFSNAEHYIERYFNQMAGLQELLQGQGDTLTLVLGYGDSTDATDVFLHEETVHRFDARLIDVSHGGKVYGSVVDSTRFSQLATIGNKLWANLPDSADIVGLVESDLAWEPQSLSNLIEVVRDSIQGKNVPLVLAPMVMTSEGQFYDTWAFRKNGINFRSQAPFHRDLRHFTGRYLEMDSVGSVFFVRGDIAEQLVWSPKDVVVGICHQARELGATVLLDTLSKVIHP